MNTKWEGTPKSAVEISCAAKDQSRRWALWHVSSLGACRFDWFSKFFGCGEIEGSVAFMFGCLRGCCKDVGQCLFSHSLIKIYHKD